ncbi:MAG: hypothetical protein NW223_05055 [Hyphomicrobiaceae bacterium]|nr:hypothetical protein [Hyphomicrobiaceae bacterium]
MPSSRKEERKVWAGIVMIAGAVVAGLVFIALTIVLIPPALDEHLCLRGAPPRNIIILIDKTDRWSDDQAAKLKQHIERIVLNELQTLDKLWLFSFTDIGRNTRAPLFVKCKPQDRSRFYDNERYVQYRLEQLFLKPLGEIAAEVVKFEEHSCSPIVDAILDVVLQSDFSKSGSQNMLNLFSDMRENTASYSLIPGAKCAPPGRVTDEKIRKRFESRKSDIRLAAAKFYQIPIGRQPLDRAQDDKRVRDFWNGLFRLLDLDIQWHFL